MQRELTPEQQALIEKEVKRFIEITDCIGGDEHSFKDGIREVLDNPEKYGLTSIENLESYKHQRDFYRNKIRELKGGKSVIDGLEGDFDNDSKIVQS